MVFRARSDRVFEFINRQNFPQLARNEIQTTTYNVVLDRLS